MRGQNPSVAASAAERSEAMARKGHRFCLQKHAFPEGGFSLPEGKASWLGGVADLLQMGIAQAAG